MFIHVHVLVVWFVVSVVCMCGGHFCTFSGQYIRCWKTSQGESKGVYETVNNDIFTHCTSCCASLVPSGGFRLTLCGNQEACMPGAVPSTWACMHVYMCTCVCVCMLVHVHICVYSPLAGPWVFATGWHAPNSAPTHKGLFVVYEAKCRFHRLYLLHVTTVAERSWHYCEVLGLEVFALIRYCLWGKCLFLCILY